MSNPWLKKNSFMSMWLSAAHKATNTARGQVAASAKRQSKAAIDKATKDAMSFWTSALTPKAEPKAKPRAKPRSKNKVKR